MALVHDFLIISPERLQSLISLNKLLYPNNKFRYKSGDNIYWPTNYTDADDSLLTIVNSSIGDSIGIDDDIILPILHCLENVDTLYGGFIPYRGLNYYGFTVIPFESIPSLIYALHKVQKESELEPLLQLCDIALIQKQYILHCGI